MVYNHLSPKRINCFRFQGINYHEDFSYTKLVTSGIIFEPRILTQPYYPTLFLTQPVDPRTLFFYQIMSCLPSESIQLFSSKLPLSKASSFGVSGHGSRAAHI